MAKQIGERLVEAGLVTRDAVEQALAHQKLTGHKLGDCLVDMGLVSETTLLRFLASDLNTRFVTTEKLSKARIDHALLDKIPVRMAEGKLFIPISIDAEHKVLSIVANEPQDQSMIDELVVVTGVEEVYPFVALRSAISAAIQKHYYGDVTAFEYVNAAPSGSGPRSSLAASDTGNRNLGSRSQPGIRFDTDPRLRNVGSVTGSRLMLTDHGTVSDADFAETLNIVVGLHESARLHLHGHSAQLARQAALVARRMGHSPREVANIVIAAHLHDLGKPQDRHFTLASGATNPDWKRDAARHCRAPIKLFENVHLPIVVTTILSQLYEAFDGSGVPGGLKGEDIHFGARVLAVLDATLDLMKNPANAFGATLSRDDVLRHVSDASGTLYDPMVVDVVRQVYAGDLLRQRLHVDGRQLMVADPDDAVRTDLMDALARLGLTSQAVSTVDGAIDACLAGETDLLVLGLSFGLSDVCGIIELARRLPPNAALPVIVLGEPPDSGTKEQLAQVSPTAVIPMPFDPDHTAAQILGIYQDRILHGGAGRLVPGSFDEIGPLALLEIFGRDKKSGRISFRGDGGEGYWHFERGKLVYAALGDQLGEAALRALIYSASSEFTYDPEALLLEMPQFEADAEAIVTELRRAG